MKEIQGLIIVLILFGAYALFGSDSILRECVVEMFKHPIVGLFGAFILIFLFGSGYSRGW